MSRAGIGSPLRRYELYKALFRPVEDLIDGKQLLVVPSGALTSLPFQVLVTASPQSEFLAKLEEYRSVPWLGAADWNTLAAAIRREALSTPESASSPAHPDTERDPARFSAELRSALHRAFHYARQRKHEYTTLEHVLLALIDDLNASGVMNVCDVDLAALRKDVTSYIDNDLKTLGNNDSRKSSQRAFRCSPSVMDR